MLRKVYTTSGAWSFVRDDKNMPVQSMPAKKSTPVLNDISKQRFEICKACEKSSEEGFKCSLRKGCCFGRWRANPDNQCPEGRWPVVEKPANAKE